MCSYEGDREIEAQLEMVRAGRKAFGLELFFKPQPLTRNYTGASDGIQFSQGVRVHMNIASSWDAKMIPQE